MRPRASRGAAAVNQDLARSWRFRKMEGVSGFGADVGTLADAVSEASNDWRKVIVRPSHGIPNRVSIAQKVHQHGRAP